MSSTRSRKKTTGLDDESPAPTRQSSHAAAHALDAEREDARAALASGRTALIWVWIKNWCYFFVLIWKNKKKRFFSMNKQKYCWFNLNWISNDWISIEIDLKLSLMFSNLIFNFFLFFQKLFYFFFSIHVCFYFIFSTKKYVRSWHLLP